MDPVDLTPDCDSCFGLCCVLLPFRTQDGFGADKVGGEPCANLELVKGAYGNLILFSSAQGPINWRENPVHHRAVEISPQNYWEIRLHQGTLSGRLLDGGELHLRQTKYIDYSEPEIWRAVRRLPPL